MESDLTIGLTSVMATITGAATDIGPKVVLAAAAGIGLSAIGLGMRFLWKTFRGMAK